MSHYPNLNPIFASSVMKISSNKENDELQFSNTITYDYIDKCNNPDFPDYYSFLKISRNFDKEINLYWNNLQKFLDAEINIINEKTVKLDVIHCNIYFRDKKHPFVQWIVEFKGPLLIGVNIYENIIEKETLEYSINSLYIFEKKMEVKEIKTSLQYNLASKRIIEYYGEEDDVLNGYESIEFTIE